MPIRDGLSGIHREVASASKLDGMLAVAWEWDAAITGEARLAPAMPGKCRRGMTYRPKSTVLLDAILSGEQCARARCALELPIYRLAALANVSHRTIRRLELGETVISLKRTAIREALELAGIDFHAGGVRVRGSSDI